MKLKSSRPSPSKVPYERDILWDWARACESAVEQLDARSTDQARADGAGRVRRARAGGAVVASRRVKMWTVEGLAASVPLCALAFAGVVCLMIPMILVAGMSQVLGDEGKRSVRGARAWDIGDRLLGVAFFGTVALVMTLLGPLIKVKRRALWALAEMSLLDPKLIPMSRFWAAAGLNPYSAAVWALEGDMARARALVQADEAICLFTRDGTLKICLMNDPILRGWAKKPLGWLWALNFQGPPGRVPWVFAKRAMQESLNENEIAMIEPWMNKVRIDDERETLAEVTELAPAVPKKARRL